MAEEGYIPIAVSKSPGYIPVAVSKCYNWAMFIKAFLSIVNPNVFVIMLLDVKLVLLWQPWLLVFLLNPALVPVGQIDRRGCSPPTFAALFCGLVFGVVGCEPGVVVGCEAGVVVAAMVVGLSVESSSGSGGTNRPPRVLPTNICCFVLWISFWCCWM